MQADTKCPTCAGYFGTPVYRPHDDRMVYRCAVCGHYEERLPVDDQRTLGTALAQLDDDAARRTA